MSYRVYWNECNVTDFLQQPNSCRLPTVIEVDAYQTFKIHLTNLPSHELNSSVADCRNSRIMLSDCVYWNEYTFTWLVRQPSNNVLPCILKWMHVTDFVQQPNSCRLPTVIEVDSYQTFKIHLTNLPSHELNSSVADCRNSRIMLSDYDIEMNGHLPDLWSSQTMLSDRVYWNECTCSWVMK